MTQKIAPDVLHRHWVHSHEEDSGDQMVFRPADFKFPPSRGRRSFQLNADGTLIEAGPAPDDRRQQSQGTWEFKQEAKPMLHLRAGANPQKSMQVISADKDRLVIQK